jgi:hypothetical protein
MTKYRIVVSGFETTKGNCRAFRLEKLKEGWFWNKWVTTRLLSDNSEELKEMVRQAGGELVE